MELDLERHEGVLEGRRGGRAAKADEQQRCGGMKAIYCPCQCPKLKPPFDAFLVDRGQSLWVGFQVHYCYSQTCPTFTSAREPVLKA